MVLTPSVRVASSVAETVTLVTSPLTLIIIGLLDKTVVIATIAVTFKRISQKNFELSFI
jgi:hypothetical protein